MLNELYELAQSLKSSQVKLTSWHQHFKPCPKGTATYLVMVANNGDVVSVLPIEERERITSIRKWEVENGVSFPGFNTLPLFEPRGDDDKKAAATLKKSLTSKSPPSSSKIRDGIESLIRASDSLWLDKEARRIDKCLSAHAKSLSDRLGSPPNEYRAIADLFERANGMSAASLHRQLQDILIGVIIGSLAIADKLFDMFFFHNGKTATRVSLILELADCSKFEYPANHQAVQAWMNSQLQDSADRPPLITMSMGGTSDAYANLSFGREEKFPSVRLPVMGNVILRAMSSESPCQKRYGFDDSDSYPVGKLTRQEMKNALEWISGRERQFKTWDDVSSLNGVPGLLFAYPLPNHEVVPEVAGLLCGFDTEADPDGARFEACAQRVTAALTAKAHDASGEIHVFVLAKPDGFRTKVVHSDRYSISRLLQGARDWQQGADNIPYLRIRRFGLNKGDKAFWAATLTPYPLQLAACLNIVWERSGTNAMETSTFGIQDALGLLLERAPILQVIAMRAIHMLLINSQGLILALGQAHNQYHVHPVSKKYHNHLLFLPSILGLLLAKLERRKEDYMKGPPFLIGRLLSLADKLHVQYCYGVRKGQIPPQLVGNALMVTALDQPTKALAMLFQRIRPYHAWATTVRDGENIGLAKYLLGQMGHVTTDLAAAELPVTCNDMDKAEMFLGYLAHSETEKAEELTTSSMEQGTNK